MKILLVKMMMMMVMMMMVKSMMMMMKSEESKADCEKGENQLIVFYLYLYLLHLV